MNKMPQYMNYAQTMEYLGIHSYKTLYKFIREGLKVSYVAGTKRIKKTDVDDFMKKHAANPLPYDYDGFYD